MMNELEMWAKRGRWLLEKMSERTTPDGRTVLEISEEPIWAKADGTFHDYCAAVDDAMDEDGFECAMPDADTLQSLRFDAFGEPRQRFVRVSLEGSNHCIMHPSEGDCYLKDARDAGDEATYTVTDVWLSEREFEDLPEHDGF